MSGRSDWVPLAACVTVGAGLFVVFYKMFFSGTGSYSKTVNQNIGATKYCCTCRKGGLDLVIASVYNSIVFILMEVVNSIYYYAEELERRKRAPAIPPSRAGWGWGGEAKSWLPIVGGATLLAIVALLYKSLDKMKALVWRTNSCGQILKTRKQEQEKIKLCICKD